MARASRIALDMALEASKKLKPALGTAWQYVKSEIVPPMTLNFFHGPKGKNLEDYISKTADNFISRMHNKICEIETEKMREIKRKEVAAKVLVEKLKVESKRKAEEGQKNVEAMTKKAKVEVQKKAQATTKAISDIKKIVLDGKELTAKKSIPLAKREPIAKHELENKKGSPKTKPK